MVFKELKKIIKLKSKITKTIKLKSKNQKMYNVSEIRPLEVGDVWVEAPGEEDPADAFSLSCFHFSSSPSLTSPSFTA